MDNEITNLFSQFAPDGIDGDGQNQEFNVDGEVESGEQPDGEQPEGGEGEGEHKDGDTVTIKKQDWDETQRVLAEFKGYMTAQNSRKTEQPQVEQPVVQQPQYTPQQQQAALDQVFTKIGEKLIEDPKEGAKQMFALMMQASAQQAQQFAAPAATSAVDLMIENFVTRKQSKDPLYDKGVGEKFEEMVKKIDPRQAAGATRAQITEALDTLYQRAKGDWADEQFNKAQTNRKTPARQEPTNYGGGRSSKTGGHSMTIPDTWKAFAKSAGIPESEITPEFFAGAEE